MQRTICSILLMILIVISCGCQAEPKKASKEQALPALTALVNEISSFDNRIYVYRDYADGWNHFTQRTWRGEYGIKPILLQEYATVAYSGTTSIHTAINFKQQKWGGFLFLNGALGPGEFEPILNLGEVDAGMDLTGAQALVFYARGQNGGEKVEFFCSGLGHNELGPQEPFADSAPKISTGIITLSTEWKQYTLKLNGYDLKRISCGFGWIAQADHNKEQEQIEFLVDEVYFSVNTPPEKLMLASYSPVPTAREDYVINNAAFVNDNALACIALFRGGQKERASQIAQGLVFAAKYDRYFSDGRIRNAYQSGTLNNFPGWYSGQRKTYAVLPSFYLFTTQRWHEDYYMVSSDLTSIAWAILALCEAAENYPEQTDYAVTAKQLAKFALQFRDENTAGFYSGFGGWEQGQKLLEAKSTQYNLEIMAAFKRVASLPGIIAQEKEQYLTAAQSAESFILQQYDPEQSCFLPGLGVARTSDSVLLDSNSLAALILPVEYQGQKEKALHFVREHLRAQVGYSCSDTDLKGIWWSGTAQMALALIEVEPEETQAELSSALQQAKLSSGMLPAASIDYLDSGRRNIGDERPTYFFNRAHIGATAWLALVEMNSNPFISQKIRN